MMRRQPEDRSFALHQLVAEKLRANPVLLGHALANLDRWLLADGCESLDRQEWRRLLAGPLSEVLAVLMDPGERGVRLRKATPFPGILTEEERLRILKKWREGQGAVRCSS